MLEVGVSSVTGDPKEAVIDISESWKGVVAGKVVVATEVHSGMCGISFEEHATFLVFAYVAQAKETSSEGETNGKENQPSHSGPTVARIQRNGPIANTASRSRQSYADYKRMTI